MQKRRFTLDDTASDKLIIFALVGLVVVSLVSITTYFVLDSNGNNTVTPSKADWIDPVIEVEDDNHSHSDLLAHRLSTDNIQLIDYHNLNCDGNADIYSGGIYYVGNGLGSFEDKTHQLPKPFQPEHRQISSVIADINGDICGDLVMSDFNGVVWVWMSENGNNKKI